MPQAVAGAVVTAIGVTGTAAAIVSIGTQLAVAYAITSLTEKKTSAADVTDEERTIESTGGTSVERMVYGRAKVSGTRYMLQKYNGYIYHGIAICRHPCEEIEAIYFDDKLSTNSDFSNAELASYIIEFVNNGNGTATMTITIEGVTYSYDKVFNENVDNIRDGFLSQMTDTDELVFTADGSDSILVTRISGSVSEWDIDITANEGGSGIDISIRLQSGKAETEKYFRLITELGNQTEANADLVSELDFDGATFRWTDEHKLTGITHINVRWDADFLKDELQRVPAITVVMKGKNDVYDPRDSSYGYSTNPALLTRDWLTQSYGFDAKDAELPDDVFIAAANVCDEQVVIDEEGTTQDRYSINTVLTTDSQPADNLTILSQSMQAPIGWVGGGWHVKPAKYEIPEIELTVDDFAGNLQYTERPSIQDRYNKMQGTFINPLQEWSAHDYPSIIVEDGMETRTGEFTLTTEIDYIRAQRLAQLHLLLNYANAAAQIHIKRLDVYIPVDSMIYLTVEQLGWDKKPFYVSARSDNEDTTATLTLLPRQSEMFDWDYTQAQEVDTITSSPIFDIREELN